MPCSNTHFELIVSTYSLFKISLCSCVTPNVNQIVVYNKLFVLARIMTKWPIYCRPALANANSMKFILIIAMRHPSQNTLDFPQCLIWSFVYGHRKLQPIALFYVYTIYLPAPTTKPISWLVWSPLFLKEERWPTLFFNIIKNDYCERNIRF